MSYSKRVLEEKRPGDLSEIPVSKLGTAQVCRCLQLPGSCGTRAASPGLPPASASPQAPPHQPVGWCPQGPSVTHPTRKRPHRHLHAGRRLPLQAPGPRLPPAMGWGTRETSEGKKGRERAGRDKFQISPAGIGLKQASLHSPQHTEVLPHPCFSGNLIGGEREERGTRREGRKAESAKETGSGTGHLNVSNCPGVWTLVGHAILPPASSQRVPD